MKMRKNTGNIMKRSAALFLALVMVCAMFPAEVFADLAWYYDESGNLFAVDEPAVVPEQPQWYVGADGLLYPITEEVTGYTEELTEEISEAVAEEAEEPEQPEEPFTYISGTAEDSAVFTAYGRFPEGSEMFVTQCDFGGDLMRKVFPAERAEKVTEYKAYNVSFTLNGQPYDPDMVLKFTVVPNMQNPTDTLSVSTYSPYDSTVPVNENGIVLSSEQVEEMVANGEEEMISYVTETFYNCFDIAAEPEGDNKLVFWSDLYTPIVIYREGFDFAPVPWVLTADRSVTLSSILETSEIGLGISDIAEQGIIYLGDPELVKMRVHEFDGDWEITSAQGFSAAQVLKVLFKNGGVLNIELYCEGNDPAPEIESEKETWNDWVEMFANVELTGSWPQDVVTIAKTQLGYTASETDYDYETHKGYTRYGAWYGDEYGDWCAMFCSFCMAFAGVDREVIPFEQSCERWIEQLKVKELYQPAGNGYTPKPGDLIFFSSNGEESDHVGIVYDNEPGQIVTIDGNNPDQVEHKFYLHDDARILGYGQMPERSKMVRSITSKPAEDGAIATVTGNLPENAEIVITPIQMTRKDIYDYFGGKKSAIITDYTSYDIKIMVNGVEWQPDEAVNVVIENPRLNIEDSVEISVAHINEITDTPNYIDAVIDENQNVKFEADSFSPYVLSVEDASLVTNYRDAVTVPFTKAAPLLASESTENIEGLELSKKAVYNNDGTYTLTLETYTTGEVKQESESGPLDIVFVLDTSGSMDETMADGTKKITALKTAVTSFINQAAMHYDPQKSDHRIAMVTFSSEYVRECGWTPLDTNGKSLLNSIVSGLTADGGTSTDEGMGDAVRLFGSEYSYNGQCTADRTKAVILFSDGVPGQSDYGRNEANRALSSAQNLKNSGVLVYTIGVFDGADRNELFADRNKDYGESLLTNCTTGVPDEYWEFLYSIYGFDWKVYAPIANRFMNYASSNFQYAPDIGVDDDDYGRWSEYDWVYTITAAYTRTANNYYLTAENQAQILDIFSEIIHEISMPTIRLGKDAKVYDTVTDSFTIPESATVSLYTENCTGEDVDGNFTFGQRTAFTAGSYTIADNKKVTVTGFDYDANFCAKKPDGTYTGKKLIVEFTIIPKQGVSFDTGDVVDTNGDDSGVYSKESGEDYHLIDVYEIPDVPPTKIAIKYVDEEGTEIKESEDVYVLPTVSYTAVSAQIEGFELDTEDPELEEDNKKTVTPGTESMTIIFHYKKSAVTLTIGKEVQGNDTDTRFPFRLTLSDENGDGIDISSEIEILQSEYPDCEVSLKENAGVDIPNVIMFSLADGETIEFDFIPVGAKTDVEELNNGGYITANKYRLITDPESEWSAVFPGTDWSKEEIDGNTEVLFVNTAGTLLPKTGGEGFSQYYATGALLIAGACIYGGTLKRKRERRAT